MKPDSEPTIRDLFPNFTEEELAKAEDDFDRYLLLVLRIFNRLKLQKIERKTDLTEGTGTVRCQDQG